MKGLATLLIALCCLVTNTKEEYADEMTQRVKAYSNEIDSILVDKVLKGFTALDALEKKYSDLALKSVAIDPSQLLREKVGNLKKIFRSREELVKRVAEEAERLRGADSPEDITSDDVTFYDVVDDTNSTNASDVSKMFYRNAKCSCGYQLPRDPPVNTSACYAASDGYEISSHFGNRAVSYEMSAVHIPTETYNEDPDVLRDIYLSDGMSEVLRKEVCKDSSDSRLTRFIYFTTQRGVMRFFPDRIWNDDCDMPDVYDSRTSPWFIQSISSPKDVTLLIDNSGSVQGLTLNLFYRMVRHFLDTLSANDFVNIVLFNEHAEYISDKCTGLLQATPRNKQILNRWMENIRTGNLSSFEEGFDLALETVDPSTHEDSHRANCNPIVVLFTDGGATYPENALKRWNSQEDKRVFSFAVGKHFYDTETTMQIACNNRGNYSSVPSYTATKSEVQSYVWKISEPLVHVKKKLVKWTLPYRDQLGLGLVMSASIPVYEDKNNRSKSLGVVGTDVLLDDLKEAVSDPEMNPDFYPFAIDNNGFVLFHPELIEDSYEDMVTMDLADLEHDNILKIRKDMIDQKEHTEKANKELLFDGRYLSTSEYTYSYTPVNDTVFSLGLAIHSSKLKAHNTREAVVTYYPDLTLEKIIEEQSSDTISLIYSTPCKNKKVVQFNPCEMPNGTDEIMFEKGVTLDNLEGVACDTTSQLYSSLLLHASLSDDIASKNWDTNSSVRDSDGVLATFTALETPSFLRIKFHNFSKQVPEMLKATDDVIKKDILSILSNPRNCSYLRRAIHEPKRTVYSYVDPPPPPQEDISTTAVPYSTSATSTTEQTTGTSPSSTESMYHSTTMSSPTTNRGYIVAVRAVKTSNDDPSNTPVVTGVVLHPDTFTDNLFNMEYKCNGSSNCTTETDLLCKDPQKAACLVLDEGGYLISSNQEEHADKMNKFFGMIDGEFMRSLITEDVYSQKYIYNHQAICEKVANEKSAGTARYFVPTIADMISFGWWLSSAAKMFLYSFIQTSMFTLWSLFDKTASHSSGIAGIEMPIKQEQCILRSAVVSFGPNSHLLYGTFGCTEICSRSYRSVRLERTNLLLIVADPVSMCREDCSKNVIFSNEAVDVTNEKMCANKTKRYRRQPDLHCYDAKMLPKDLDSPCGASSLLPRVQTILFFVFLRLVICKYSTE